MTRRLGGASRRDPPRAARVVARTTASRVAHPSRSGVLRPRRSRRASSRDRGRASVASHIEESRSLKKLPVWNGSDFRRALVRPSPARRQIRRGRPPRASARRAHRAGRDAAPRRGRSRGRVGASARPPATTRTARRFRVRNIFERAEIFRRLVALVQRLFSRDVSRSRWFFFGTLLENPRLSLTSPSRPLSVPGTAPDRR